jgi:hypothetical protein
MATAQVVICRRGVGRFTRCPDELRSVLSARRVDGSQFAIGARIGSVREQERQR